MERKEFIKKGFSALGLAVVSPIFIRCDDSDDDPTQEVVSGGDGSCEVTPSETEGPFPTKNPTSLERVDIRSDREGIEMAINITILNGNNDCAVLKEAYVDIWHCDRDGNYSEYGGTGMQMTDYTSAHFLRGRQQTDVSGLVTFTSIFPGWYASRAPHIHVHIYDASGKSLLVTQIAFPEELCNTVYTTATQYYTKGTQDTSNERDNVFGDGYDLELATVTGNITDGFVLTHSIVVNA
ncbi:intradiol ring-cleavage dioxygenase [Limibacter armeniacum]|uniref:dioxygenase family protein n=1 Tax=Limibacter armeniacum TaxID=466084 RepID=UPI002FE5ECF5